MGYEHVIPEFIMRLKSNETPFRIFGGKETRAFCFVQDAIRATQLCMESEKTENQIFHIGNDLEEISIENLARKIFAIMEVRPELKIEPAPQGSVQRRCPDLTKIRKLGYTPSVSLDKGLQKTIDWYMKKTFKH
jgi:nucleoside-diphosphate-sugar epimerase